MDFEPFLGALASRCANIASDEMEAALRAGLACVRDFFGVDRIAISMFANGNRRLQVLASCAAEGFGDMPPVELDRELPWWVEEIRMGRTINLQRAPDDLPPHAAREKAFLLREGCRSHLCVPLRMGGDVLGALALDSLTRSRAWSPELVARLQLVGCVLAGPLARKRSDEALRASLDENKRLHDRLKQESLELCKRVLPRRRHGRIVGQSDTLKKVLAEAEQVAITAAPVLLLGETGAGKELLAETIHELSARGDRPMVVVNCASLPATLVESELFGREVGAYTGAASAQIGRFTIADGSTLFLDEIGEFPIELQAKLLRVLQDGRFERLGSPKTVTVDVRIIAATNRDLQAAVREGQFRSDLYHRLNVFPIRVPPLRDRREDIPLLTWAFVESIGRRMGKTIRTIPRKSMEQLQRYSWPGNVRELSNIVERAMILSSGETLHIEVPTAAQNRPATLMTLKEHERAIILQSLQQTRWRIRGPQGAAELLGLKPTTLEARMAKLGIKRAAPTADESSR